MSTPATPTTPRTPTTSITASEATPALPLSPPPLHQPSAESVRFKRRIIASIVFLVCASILGVARWLEPASEGLGTHTQLGLSTCSFLDTTGLPCPTCGMTTSFTHAAHGRLDRAAIAQPAGALLAIATAMLAVLSFVAIFTAAPLGPLTHWLWRPAPLLVAIAILVIAWLYKIAAVSGA